jgi:hypothetical protein
LSNLIFNERAKLSATFVNGVAIALFAVGGLAPVVGQIQNGDRPLGTTIFAAGCVAGAFGLHLVARWLLRGMRE